MGTPSKQKESGRLAQHLAAAHALASGGDLRGALQRLQADSRRWPASAAVWQLFGDVLHGSGNLPAALVAYQRAAPLEGAPADAHQRLAETAMALDQWEIAVGALSALLVPSLNCPASLNTPASLNRARLGIALQALDRFAAAAEQYALALPDAEPAVAYTLHLNYGTCLHQLQSYRAAAEQARLAAQVASSAHQRDVARRNEGSARLECGDLAGAREAFAASRLAASSALYASNFVMPYDGKMVCAEHRRWGQQAVERAGAASEAEATLPPRRPVDPDRPLRIGFVSADFRQHPVAFFFAGLLTELRRIGCQCVLYADVQVADAVSERLRAQASRWVNSAAMSDAELGACVAADAIDVLVDLGGHTSERISFFARRRAMVQVEYLGYAATTGLPSFDAYLSDALLDPLADGNDAFVEPLLRLPLSAFSYSPPADAPPVGPSPAQAAGRLCFASFNRPHKLNDPTLALWARVLNAVPDSRLLIVGKGFAQADSQQALRQRFQSLGVAAERLEWRGQLSFDQYLALHGEVDLLLDCLPWSGHTVTAHAAWMGVPTLTLRGDHHAGRFSAAVMQLVGAAGCVAATTEALVATAVHFAGNIAELAVLRQRLRGQMAASALLDHHRLALSFEQALRRLLSDRGGSDDDQQS